MGAMRLLWATSRPLGIGVGAWAVAQAAVPALVVAALGAVVGAVADVVGGGFGPAAEHRLVAALVAATVLYAVSLVLGPIGSALGTAARTRVTGALQGRLLRAVSAPAGVAHLEDTDVLDRLARAEGTLTGLFPGDAPVTWAGAVAGRASGLVGCVVVALHTWWVGLGIAVVWVVARRLLLGAVVAQATVFRGQTTAVRRSWYFASLGSKAAAAKETRVFGLGGFLAEQFRLESVAAIDAAAPALRAVRRRAAAGTLLAFAGATTALVVITEDARVGGLGVTALATLLPMLAVTMALGSAGYSDVTLAMTLAALPDVDGLEHDLAGDGAPAGSLSAADLPRAEIRFDGVRFAYPGQDRPVLDGLDLVLSAGRSTAVVGVNGAGKSTLVSLLARLREPTGGRITVDGADVTALDARSWQQTIALVPQEPVHYPFSAYDNVALGAVAHRDDREGVEAAAEQAGFGAVVATLPAGWDTVLTRELPGGVDLSGGQWQRLALARALFAVRHGARVLVLDEPTAALDVRGEAAFYARFLEITHGLTTVVISHRFATVRRADSIVVLEGGRISARGTHDELVAAGGTYADMYAVQAERFA